MTLRRFHCGRLVHAFEISKLRMVTEKVYEKSLCRFSKQFSATTGNPQKLTQRTSTERHCEYKCHLSA
ncbi:hypothetical protein P5673_019578 [Acropora cervicornis]|uniref:Uncharacterized protein n=1 Tax=Acropora cervicornis TaxID=6130 RepID=A0AAD9QBV5_ACRCE|nr:hypothetical protein P5673_019578 [Acropora cervicornis]